VNTTQTFRVFAQIDKQQIIEDLSESGPGPVIGFVLDLVLHHGSEDVCDSLRSNLRSLEWVKAPEEEEEEVEDGD
tara:strand:+ start:3175 stop:3399 length:225 start_codon:yes stop_codon:yes gene_type:complete